MKRVLITGCSRGIGHHAAIALADRGWTVVGTVRGGAGRHALAAAGVEVATLDVRDLSATRTLVADIVARHGGLDAVVANAGHGLLGCFEDVDPGQVHDLFETNVHGAMHTVRACLPHLRASAGRVVVVSSVAGMRAAPGSSAYNASKFALEGWGEALRFELAPFGVQVVMIQPGATDTGFVATRPEGPRSGTGVYTAITARLREVHGENSLRHEPVDVVVRPLIRALEHRRPPFRMPTGRGTRAQILAHRLLPWSLWQALVQRKLNLPRP